MKEKDNINNNTTTNTTKKFKKYKIQRFCIFLHHIHFTKTGGFCL